MKENEIMLFDGSMVNISIEPSFLGGKVVVVVNKSMDDILDVFNYVKSQVEKSYLEFMKSKENVFTKFIKKIIGQNRADEIYLNSRFLKDEFKFTSVINIYNNKIIEDLKEKIVFEDRLGNYIKTPEPTVEYSKEKAGIVERVVFEI